MLASEPSRHAAAEQGRLVSARWWYFATVPERALRALFAGIGGTVHETAHLMLPRFVRRSRLYEATAKNALRIAVEFVGGVAPDARQPAEADGAGRVAVKKAAGNVVELGSIAAFGFSPLWLLAGASDVMNGTRVFLRALEDELSAAGVLSAGTHFGSVDQLIGALEGTTGTTAHAIDLPPLELSELKRSLAELRGSVGSLPAPAELMRLFNGLVATATTEQRSLLEVSTGVGLAFVTSAKAVGQTHVWAPYREDWAPLREEGFGAYATRVARPYREAVVSHFDSDRRTLTERAPAIGQRAAGGAWRRLRSLRFPRWRGAGRGRT
ncbi:MAG: hypothetical protein AB7I38_00795 [Dehalococcoidia bacterium]